MQKFWGEFDIAGVGEGVYESPVVCKVGWFGDVICGIGERWGGIDVWSAQKPRSDRREEI